MIVLRIKKHKSSLSCHTVNCQSSDLVSPRHGILIGTDLSNGSTACFECNEGYVLQGNMSRMCFEGQWTGENPTCGEYNYNTPTHKHTEILYYADDDVSSFNILYAI